MKHVEESVSKAVSRRSFLAGAGTAAAATVFAGCSGGTVPVSMPITPLPTTPTTPTYTDTDYLNFALNLEYLEAEFYLRAATGSGLSLADAGSDAGAVTGGAQVSGFSALQQSYIDEIAQNELDHVRLLRSALGSAAVARPAIDLTNSFNALAVAAGVVAAGGTFNAFANPMNYLIGAFTFEDVGVTAYHGATKLLTSKTNLGVAARIMAVEAYHAASIRSQILLIDATMPSSPYLAYANDVSALRAMLGGGNETAISATTIVPCDITNAIAFERTTDEVLHIVYGTAGGSGVKSGGFFPSGMNGTISATLS